MFGHPADLTSIFAVADGIPVIEDCAQSLLARYKGEYTGVHSDASFFSFRSGKYISAGEGSVILAKDPSLRKCIAEFVETFKEWTSLQQAAHCISTYIKSSMYKRPWYGTIGYPLGKMLDRKLNLTAKTGFEPRKIANCHLKIITERIGSFYEKVAKQRQYALYLMERLSKIEVGILPYEKEGCFSNYYQFPIRFSDTRQRDFMANYLFRRGIDTAKYLDEVVDLAYREYHYEGDCPNAQLCSKTILIIPNHYNLSSYDLMRIVDVLEAGSYEFNGTRRSKECPVN
jgi:dTDP-4-amino-4,6-dideoxygalactose transaminase